MLDAEKLKTQQLEQRYRAIVEKIQESASACNRDFTEVTLVAVSKKKPAADIEVLYDLGHRDFGENYLQEMLSKQNELAHLKGVRWHFIGRLQSNKLQKIVKNSDYIHACSSLEHLTKIDRYAKSLGKRVELFVAIRFEPHKDGFEIAALDEVFEKAANLDSLDVKGLMCIPPFDLNDRTCLTPPLQYQQLSQATNEYRLPCLSLGMSSDINIAVHSGATHLRIGQAIFGKR